MNFVKFISIYYFLTFSVSSHSGMFEFLNKNKYILSPEINGIIYDNNQASSNVNVYLEVGYDGKYYKYQTKTDIEGSFHFNPVVHSQWFKPNPLNQNYVGINLFAEYNREIKKLWESTRSNLFLPNHIPDNLKFLKCNISNPEREFNFSNEKPGAVDYFVHSVCDLQGFRNNEIREKD